MGYATMDGASQHTPAEVALLFALPGVLYDSIISTSTAPKPVSNPALPAGSTTNDDAFPQSNFLSGNNSIRDSNTASPMADIDTSKTPGATSGYISKEEHEVVLLHNVVLAKELLNTKEEAKQARNDAEQAKLAFRKLAEWTYQERQMLLCRLAYYEATSGCWGFAKDGSQSNMKETTTAISESSPLVPMSDVINCASGATRNKEEKSDGSEDYEPPEVPRESSISEAIDELIAEEKGRLPFADS